MKDESTLELEDLVEIVYHELVRLARSKMARERPGHTLQPSDLANEAVLKLLKNRPQLGSKEKLIGIAGRAMRQVLVDYSRRRSALKRGGDRVRVPLTESDLPIVPAESPDRIQAVHEALEELSSDPQLVQVAELIYFVGFSQPEVAAILEISVQTVGRRWRTFKTYLSSKLERPEG